VSAHAYGGPRRGALRGSLVPSTSLSALRGSVTTASGNGDFHREGITAWLASPANPPAHRIARNVHRQRRPRAFACRRAGATSPRACSAHVQASARAPRDAIRLSGSWLERIGFPKGARYLISVEKEFRTIILQGSFEKPELKRR
jgi:hypothetical protein